MDPENEATETETEATQEPTEQQEGQSLEEQLAHWKAMARKNEQRAKENAQKAKAYDDVEEQSKTELQKALDRATQAEEALKAAEVARLRAEIATSKGVPIDLLHGSTEEEISAAAEAALSWRGRQTDFGAGKRGESVKGPKTWTREDLVGKTSTEINAAREAGHLDQLLGR